MIFNLASCINCFIEYIIIFPYISDLQHPCTLLLCGESGSGKESIIKSSCRQLGFQILQVDCLNIVSDSPGAGEAKLKVHFERGLTLNFITDFQYLCNNYYMLS